jgi:hypothetical protein
VCGADSIFRLKAEATRLAQAFDSHALYSRATDCDARLKAARCGCLSTQIGQPNSEQRTTNSNSEQRTANSE